MERIMDYRKLIGAPILILFLAACAPQTDTLVPPTATPTATPTQDLAPTSTVIITRTEAPVPSPESSGGEWLLVNTDQGLFTIHPDGTEGALRITGPLIIPGPLAGALSLRRRRFRLPDDIRFQPAVRKLSQSDIKHHVPVRPHFSCFPSAHLAPKPSPATEYPSDIIRAMVEHKSFAWSPDGTSWRTSAPRRGLPRTCMNISWIPATTCA